MPRIATFDAPDNLGLRPTEVGISAMAGAARRVQGEYNEAAASKMALGNAIGSTVREVGDVGTRMLDHQQITHGSAAFAQLMQAKSQQWDDLAKNADPNDPTIAPRFLEGMEGDLEKFREGFLTERGQQFAESRIAHFREHMFHKTSADMASLAGQAAVVNHRQTINALSSTVRSDPSSLDFSLRTLDDTATAVVGSSPNLTGAAAGKVRMELLQRGKEEIVKAAALGWIEKTGEVPKWIEDKKYSGFVNADEIKQFQKAAQYYDRLNRSEERAARAQRDYESKNDFNRQVNELEAATMPKNAGDPPQLPSDYWDRMRKLAQHPGAALEPGRLKAMVHNGEVITDRLNKAEPLSRTSHATTMELLNRIRARDDNRLTDVGPIYDAYQAGKLNNGDFNFLTREFSNLRSPEGVALEKSRGEFTKTYARLIDGAMNTAGIHSVLGTQRMYEFEMDARRQEEALRKAGKDPHLVYDPRSEYFWGRPENVAKYRVSMQEAQAYDRTLTSMDKAAAEPAAKFSPPSSWQWSPSRQQYRDPATGRLYDKAGKEVQ